MATIRSSFGHSFMDERNLDQELPGKPGFDKRADNRLDSMGVRNGNPILRQPRSRGRDVERIPSAHLMPDQRQDSSDGTSGMAFLADEVSNVFAMYDDVETDAPLVAESMRLGLTL